MVLGNGEPTAGAAVWGCLRPIAEVVPDRGLESAPTVCGVSLPGASGVAAVLAGAGEGVEVGSVSAGVVAAAADETVEELVCGPPVATTTPGAPERAPPDRPRRRGTGRGGGRWRRRGATGTAQGHLAGRIQWTPMTARIGRRRGTRCRRVRRRRARVPQRTRRRRIRCRTRAGIGGFCRATPGALATAIPTPSATAKAPTRPMYFALPIVVPPSMSWRNDGHRVGVEFRDVNRRSRQLARAQ